jgi:hypothetical protein
MNPAEFGFIEYLGEIEITGTLDTAWVHELGIKVGLNGENNRELEKSRKTVSLAEKAWRKIYSTVNLALQYLQSNSSTPLDQNVRTPP